MSFMDFILKININTIAKKIYDSWLSSEGHTKITVYQIMIFLIFSFCFIGSTPAQNSSRIGLGFGAKYTGEDFITHINDLNIDHYFINIKWGLYELSPGDYDTSYIDAFLNQLPANSEALIRISPRGNTFYNDSLTEYTVPLDLSDTGAYYDFVSAVISRDSTFKVKYYECEWEYNFTKHWGGRINPNPDPIDLGNKYADLVRTTETAIKNNNPNALFVFGGTTRSTTAYTDTLLRTTLTNLCATDSLNGHCDFYDQHLYRDLYGIPNDLSWFNDIRNDFPAFANKPVFCTEHAGPLPSEFMTNLAFNDTLINLLTNNICLLAGDLDTLGLPGHYRMFAFGAEPSLNAKRDSIQANNYVQRTLLGLANGVERMYTWAFETQWFSQTILGNTCYIKDNTFGKLALSNTDYNNDFISTNDNYNYFKTFADFFRDTKTVIQDTSLLNQDIYFFEITTFQQDTFYVVWEKRDQYYGVYSPLINFSFNTNWNCIKTQNIFGRDEILNSLNGIADVEINDIPLVLSSCDNLSANENSSANKVINLALFPNPSSSIITIRSKGAKIIDLEIFSISGKLINKLDGVHSHSYTLHTASLEKGVYIVRIVDVSGKQQSGKLIIE